MSAEQRLAKPQPDALMEVTLEIGGVASGITVEVFGKWHEGESRTHSHPGSPRGWEITEIKYERTYLTHLFSERQLDAIAREMP